MKKTGLILTILIVAIMVVAITVKLASQGEDNTPASTTYSEEGVAGKLAEGMVGVTGSNYDEIITNSKGVVVVDYFAPTCSYCIKYSPVFSAVFEGYKTKATFGKFDVTTDRSKLSDLKIGGTPTTIIFLDGKEADRIGGYVDEATLKSKLDAVLAKQ